MTKRASVGLAVLGAVALVAGVAAITRQEKPPTAAPSGENPPEPQPVSAPSGPGSPVSPGPAAATAHDDNTQRMPSPPTTRPSLRQIPSTAFALARRQPVDANSTGALLAEASLMGRLHALAETNPPLSLQLAREGNARFPDSPDAPERSWIVVKSLVNMARFKEAQDEARIMVGKYPTDPRALDVQRQLLTNPL
jgi:hypothetical protein